MREVSIAGVGSTPFGRLDGVMQCPFHGENITMILRHGDVRQAAKDWPRFSSDAPFRVLAPSTGSLTTTLINDAGERLQVSLRDAQDTRATCTLHLNGGERRTVVMSSGA